MNSKPIIAFIITFNKMDALYEFNPLPAVILFNTVLHFLSSLYS